MAKARSSTSPTSRTTAVLRKAGATYGIVEKNERFPAPHKVDFLGVIDIIAMLDIGGYSRIVGIQATGGASKSNGNARMRKAEAEPRLKAWLESAGVFEVWSWQHETVGNRKRWLLRKMRAEMTGGEIEWKEISDG